MSAPERLAGANVVQQIRNACTSRDVHLSGSTLRLLAAQGIPHAAVLNALVQHINEGCKIHVKFYPTPGVAGYHGNLYLDPDDPDTSFYFEVKMRGQNVALTITRSMWLQLHEHNTGGPLLPR